MSLSGNGVIASALDSAHRAAIELDGLGCLIESVHVDSGKPHVRLAERPRHGFADRALGATVKTPTGMRQLMSAERGGCKVTWYEEGARS